VTTAAIIAYCILLAGLLVFIGWGE